MKEPESTEQQPQCELRTIAGVRDGEGGPVWQVRGARLPHLAPRLHNLYPCILSITSFEIHLNIYLEILNSIMVGAYVK